MKVVKVHLGPLCQYESLNSPFKSPKSCSEPIKGQFGSE